MSDPLRTAPERRLAEIIREVKVASAERDDVAAWCNEHWADAQPDASTAAPTQEAAWN